MEVDEVEDIAHFHLLEVDGERVVSFFGGDTIDENVLPTTSHQEVVDQQTVLMIDDVGGLHIPCTLMENDVGRQDAQMGLGYVLEIVIELDDAVHLSADPFLLPVVVPGERGVQLVVRCPDVGIGTHRSPVIEAFEDADITVERVVGGGNANVAVGIPAAVVGERGEIAVQPDVVGAVVDPGVDHEGLLEHEVDIEEAFQPIGLTQQHPQTEVVVGIVGLGQQTGEVGESLADEGRETLRQGLEVEISFQSGIGKVALQVYVMDAILIARHDDEVVKLIGLVLRGAGDAALADAQTTLGVVQAAGGEIGLDIC